MKAAVFALAAGAALLTLSTGADAATCRARISGEGTGQGILGTGTEKARAMATADWQSKARKRFGARFADFNRAEQVRFDCAPNALVMAKCVVTARPCR